MCALQLYGAEGAPCRLLLTVAVDKSPMFGPYIFDEYGINGTFTETSINWFHMIWKLLSREQGSLLSGAQPTCTASDEPPIQNLLVRKAKIKTHVWPSRHKQIWRVNCLELGTCCCCIVGFRSALQMSSPIWSIDWLVRQDRQLPKPKLSQRTLSTIPGMLRLYTGMEEFLFSLMW